MGEGAKGELRHWGSKGGREGGGWTLGDGRWTGQNGKSENQMKPENKIIRSKVHFNLPEDQKGGLMLMKRSGDFSQDSVSVLSASDKVEDKAS